MMPAPLPDSLPAPLAPRPAPRTETKPAEWLRRCMREGQRFHAQAQSRLLHNALNLSLTALLVDACGAILWGMARHGSWAWVAPASLLLGWCFFALFILVVHEASHGMFVLAGTRARTRQLNRLFGWAVAIPFFTHYARHWEVGHLVHHQRPLSPEDPQAANRLTGRALALRLALYVLVPGYMFLHRLTEKRAGGHRTSSRGVLLGFLAFWGTVVALLVAAGGGLPLLLTLVCAIQVLGAFNQLKGALEHGGALEKEPEMLLRSRTSLFALRWLVMPFHISMHFEHHLHMAVPWYRLPRYHRAIVPLVPEVLRPRLFNTQVLRQLEGRRGGVTVEVTDGEAGGVGADAPWVLKSRLNFALFRLGVYGTVGLASELFFYNLTRAARQLPLLAWAFRFDWRVDPALQLDSVWRAPQAALYGQASLWMFVVYGVCSLLLLEPLYRALSHWHVLARGLVYSLTILVYEWATGWGLLHLTGYRIWYYADAWALDTMTSAALVPSWIVTGLIAEGIYRGLRALAGWGSNPAVRRALEAMARGPVQGNA